MTRKIRRACAACGAAQPPEYGIPDPCLGRLPGVLNACCGHGYAGDCYVMLDCQPDEIQTELLLASVALGRCDAPGRWNPDNLTIRGEAARNVQIELGGSPSPFIHNQDHMHLPGGLMPGWEPTPQEGEA